MIDPQARVHENARLGKDVHVGPWTLIGPDVEIGDGTWIGPHVVINGNTTIGKNNKIFQFASVGEAPQDLKYAGEKTKLIMGDDNVIREYCSIHLGTVQDEGLTKIGNNNLLMNYVHIAHDCQIGDNVVMSNSVGLAGHVKVGDNAILGAFSGTHQFCRIGAYSFLSACANTSRDIPPYVLMPHGSNLAPVGINIVGLKRRGFSEQTIRGIRRAYKIIYQQGLLLEEAIVQLRTLVDECPEVQLLIDFLTEPTDRGIAR